MTVILGTDRSNYQVPWTREHSLALRDAGHRFSIIGRQRRNPSASDQAAFDLGAGVRPVGEYLMNVGGAWPTPFPTTLLIAVDVEPGSEFTTEEDIDNALLWIAGTGRRAAIYSSKWAWDALGLGYLTKYGRQGVWCWNAHYDGRSDGFELPGSYGGWETCQIDQFTAHGVVAGVPYELDVNAFEPGAWAELTGEGMSPADIRDRQDVGLNRLDGEAVGLALRDIDAEVARVQQSLATVQRLAAAARAVMTENHRRNGGDGDLIRGR